MEQLRGQPVEVWRIAKERLARHRGALSHRRELERRYEKAQAGRQKSSGRKLVGREIWEDLLDRYADDYERWVLGLCDERPGRPSIWGRS